MKKIKIIELLLVLLLIVNIINGIVTLLKDVIDGNFISDSWFLRMIAVIIILGFLYIGKLLQQKKGTNHERHSR